ncbi:MAG: phosphate ABC transporter permease PstA [Leptospiraceae bacterium]|nr:phosphate ABC transporter permease PstA [Leptospiraceae bacterium]
MDRRTLYQIYGVIFQTVCLVANFLALMFLVLLLWDIISKGAEGLTLDFLTNKPSRMASRSGFWAAIGGSLIVMLTTAFFSIPMGIGAAIYLEEYARDTKFIRFIKLNIKNLAGVPSIVYGILGLTLFVRGPWSLLPSLVGLFSESAALSLRLFLSDFLGDQFLGRSVLAGSLTLALLILPVITIASQEALRAVPQSFRQAGFGIGMTRWQVVWHMTLPVAIPGMLTGIILALSRAIGETAPLVMIGALTWVDFVPGTLMDRFTVMPIQIFNWTSLPQEEFHRLAASGIIVLMTVLLLMNGLAIYLRGYFRNKLRHLG